MAFDEQQNFTDPQQTSPILVSGIMLLLSRLFFQNPYCSASLQFSFFQSSRSFLSQQYLVTVNGYAYLGCKCSNWRIIKYSSSDTLTGYLNKDVLHATVNYGNIHYSENSDRKWGSEIFNSWEWMKKQCARYYGNDSHVKEWKRSLHQQWERSGWSQYIG